MLSVDMAEIVVEPIKFYRFRFASERKGNTKFPIKGANKSFITLKVNDFQGEFRVTVSCVTKDRYQQHPYRLKGIGCKYGFCRRTIKNGSTIVFDELEIQRETTKKYKESLDERKVNEIDPFNRGFDPIEFDKNCVRLCFQVFLHDIRTGKPLNPLHPVVSQPIHNKNNLVISELSERSSAVAGNERRILLCGQVLKNDIEVQFLKLNEKTGKIDWQENAIIDYIHKNVAIVFRTPRYPLPCTPDVHDNGSIKCFIQLYCRSDECTSERLEFEYYYEPERVRKIKRLDTNVAAHFSNNPLANESDSTYCRPSTSQAIHAAKTVSNPLLNQPVSKAESMDNTARIQTTAPIDSVYSDSDSFDSISSYHVPLDDIIPFDPNKLDNN